MQTDAATCLLLCLGSKYSAVQAELSSVSQVKWREAEDADATLFAAISVARRTADATSRMFWACAWLRHALWHGSAGMA